VSKTLKFKNIKKEKTNVETSIFCFCIKKTTIDVQMHVRSMHRYDLT